MSDKVPTNLTVGRMFPQERLKRLQVSENVRSMTPRDLRDMDAIFSREKVENAKVRALTTQDLMSLEALFSDYRQQVIANYRGIDQLEPSLEAAVKDGDSCCCCCTPCCCCSAAAETDPFWQ